MSDKLLDFEWVQLGANLQSDAALSCSIMVESEPRRTISSQQQPLKEHTSSLEESTYKLNGLLTSITRIQK
jgi:hypothetical protein